MSNQNFPFAVHLVGFANSELEDFDIAFSKLQGKGYRYFRLEEGNLQDPDLYIANADALKSLITLADLHPSEARPALLVGSPNMELPYPRVERPIEWKRLYEALDDLVERRAEALSRLEASGIVTVPERRRRDRLDLDLTDPADYEKMRTKIPDNGAVLVVDKISALRDYLSDLLSRQKVPVLWVNDEVQAVEVCKQQPVAVVMINTSTPGVDPYRLCWAIKEKDAPVKTTVIFLVSKPFTYDLPQACYVGAEGFLTKPIASVHLISTLKKFLPPSR
ncbi:MAG TPA: response regulator [Noviherbaspirillum sp.]|nr:response regulator [Noviherbaspirillum sp.]